MKTKDGKQRYFHVKYRFNGEVYSDPVDYQKKTDATTRVKGIRETGVHAWFEAYEKDSAGNVQRVA